MWVWPALADKKGCGEDLESFERTRPSENPLGWARIQKAVPLAEMVRVHRSQIAESAELAPHSKLLKFRGPGLEGKTFYNPTDEFVAKLNSNSRPQRMIAVRVEEAHLETGSEVLLFARGSDGIYDLIPGAPRFVADGHYVAMQDPTHTVIHGENILAMVEVYHEGDVLGYRTAFYRDFGKGMAELKRFAVGPPKHKDIRMVQLRSGEILVMTRPQGPGNPGTIGRTRMKNLEDFTIDLINRAPLFEGQFAPGEWGGANKLTATTNSQGEEIVVVQGHVARFDENKERDYVAADFGYNPATDETTPWTVIAERRDLARGLAGASKRGDLKNVVFTGGGKLPKRGAARMPMTFGAGDAEVHESQVKNFYSKYQN